MKHLKLFFALFAMLALNLGNAWAEEVTFSGDDIRASFNYGNNYKEGTFTSDGFSIYCSSGYGNTEAQFRVAKSATLTINSTVGNITKVVITVTGTSYKLNDNNISWSSTTGTYSNAGGVQEITFTNSDANIARISKIAITYEPSSVGGGDPTPSTTYTIKWHTAKGVTTDVVLNEGTAITKLATDPTMTGYEFMGWTEDCAVASDGTGFTAISNFGTATEDKDYYAVFAVATITSGEGSSNYEKVTSNLTDWAGDYLIAYNNTTFADGRTGGTSGMGAQNKKVDLSSNISNNSIPASVGDQYNVTLEAVTGGYVLKTKDGNYNYQASNANGLATTTTIATAAKYAITVTFTSENDIKLALTGTAAGAVFRYNTQGYFRFYKNGGQSAVYLYKKVAGGSTTTYSDYITTCASDIEYVELGDAFKWSATEAEVTIDATDNVFPTLTNTHNVPVKYSSSDDAIASIASDGTVTLNKEGTVTITAKYAGGTSAGTGKEYKAKTVTYSLKVNKAAPVASGTTYVKVTSTAGITDGEYLIVYEEGKVAFNGALNTLDAVSNTIEVEITDGKIAGTNYIDDAVFTIDATEKTIKSASGKYIGRTAYDNGLDSKTEVLTNTITISEGNAVITASGNCVLRYNKTSGQDRFRYFKSGQEPIALYKKASEHIVTIATCTNGSVEASVANDAKVLSGTTITLSNTPATNYKLTAYDVYKTGEETTKVTVTDGKFIMPEFDVTISATFELAKILTGLDITTPATQTTFWQGETFNSTGLKVTAHFDGAADEDVTDKVTITGSTATAGTQTVTVSYQEGEVTEDATYTITVKAIPNTKETAYTVADAFDIIDKLGDTDKMYITGFVSQADLVQSNIDQYKNADYWISADGTTNGQQLEAYRGKYLDNADFTSVNQIMVGDEVIIYGKLTKYNSTYEFAAGNYLVSLKRDKQQPELSYTTTEYNVNLGDAFTAPTLNNPNSLAITYSSSNEDVATVATDGAVTIKAAGTVTITASFAGDDTYVTGNASYTINVTDPNVSSVTFDAIIDKTADAETLSLTKDVITMTFTSGAMNNGENYRCYKNQTLTISATDASIQKIEFECTSSNPISGFADATGLDKTNSVWIGNAKSVELTASNSQVRMSKVNVYYKKDKRANAELAWSEETVSLTVGDAFTAPTLSNPNSVTGIEFTSSNSELATVNNAGVISLVSGKKGTATITATFAGDENYKAAEVTCVITVSPKSEKVVILAEREGQWYALKAAYLSGKTDRLEAIPVNYVGGKLYNVAEADKASIEWSSVVEGDKVSFINDGKYLKGKTTTTLLFEEDADGLYQWDNTTYTMTIGTTVRSFIYNGEAFRNFAVSNAGKVVDDILYSSLPVVTAPVYTTGTLYTIKATTENGTVTGAGVYVAGDKVTLTADPAMDNTFVNWTKGAEVVSTANPFVFEATENLDLVANFTAISQTSKTLTGEFSVGQYEVAQFATGNLQYTNGTWGFAKQQYQYVGEANINVGDPTFTGTIDMFGWSTNETNYGVDPRNVNEFYDGEFVDWGDLFPVEDNWSTLSADQWKYLLNTRDNASSLKQIARVGSVVGIMLFPDVWNAPLTVTAQRDSYFEVDIHNYTLEQWAALENAGALFLPAAGRRTGGYGNMINYDQEEETNSENLNGGHYKHQDNTNIYCYYWTSTINETTKNVSYLHNIQALGGDKYTIGTGAIWGEKGRYGQSVRLAKVTDITPETYTRTVTAGNYGTICLPYASSSYSGAEFYEVSWLKEGTGLYLDQLAAGTQLVAGKPYIFKATASEITVTYTDEAVVAPVAGANGLTGTFTDIATGDAALVDNYIIAQNQIWVAGAGNSLPANRAYINATLVPKTEQPKLAGRRRVCMGENAATGLDNITNGEDTTIKVIENGQLVIIRNGEKFNAQGIKL